MSDFKIGEPVLRVEDARFLTGRARFLDDLRVEGQAYARFVRSPHAHAEIGSIDAAGAAGSPGVLGVMTAVDLEGDGVGAIPCSLRARNRDGSWSDPPPRPLMAGDRVRHVGQVVALVVAETLEQAEDATERIVVSYEPLPANADLARALTADAPSVWDGAADNVCIDWEGGDRRAVDRAFASAAHVTTLDLVNNRLTAAPLEPRGAIGEYDSVSGRFTLHATAQYVHLLRQQLAERVFRIPVERIRVVATDMGGGFGMKNFPYPEYGLVLWAARRLGRPVRWTESRSEAFLADDQARDQVTSAALAFGSDHRAVALRVETIANFGAFAGSRMPSLPTTENAASAVGVYAIPAAVSSVKCVYTHTVPIGSYRGVGRSEAVYVIERLMDKAAGELGLDPTDLRRRNMIPAAAMPYTTPFEWTFDSGDFAGNLDASLAAADAAGFDRRRMASESRGRLRGLGIACYIDNSSGPGEEGADIRFGKDGSVTILVGTFSNGQGLETTFRQLVSDRLGVAFDRIDFVQGDTDRVAVGGGHGGSRSTEMGGSALHHAADRVIEKGRRVAARALEVADGDLEFVHGRFVVAGTDRYLGLLEVAALARDPARRPQGLDESLDTHQRYVRRDASWPNGCHVCEVEVDPETGFVEIVRYTVVDDFGIVINPMIVEGMVHGGVAQGVGQALHEDLVIDRTSGQVTSGSFMDYALPRADDLCGLDVAFNEIPCRTNPIGVKGCGEAGTVGAHPAAMNAVIAALSRYGIDRLDCPATPQRVWRAIHGRGT